MTARIGWPAEFVERKAICQPSEFAYIQASMRRVRTMSPGRRVPRSAGAR
ncbi:hypothetical protein [Rhodococcus sp. IEGM 1307]|nr:hypothetical protein [Rhodococcus sp. IEGM 1307]MDI9978777.1 hypothetical protein [Rhodococcus sp. IEGM 1307]